MGVRSGVGMGVGMGMGLGMGMGMGPGMNRGVRGRSGWRLQCRSEGCGFDCQRGV